MYDSKSNLESRKVEPRANDRFCRTLMRRQCIPESLLVIPTETGSKIRVILDDS